MSTPSDRVVKRTREEALKAALYRADPRLGTAVVNADAVWELLAEVTAHRSRQAMGTREDARVLRDIADFLQTEGWLKEHDEMADVAESLAKRIEARL